MQRQSQNLKADSTCLFHISGTFSWVGYNSLQLASVPAFCCALGLALRFVVLLGMRSLLINTNQLAVTERVALESHKNAM